MVAFYVVGIIAGFVAFLLRSVWLFAAKWGITIGETARSPIRIRLLRDGPRTCGHRHGWYVRLFSELPIVRGIRILQPTTS